MRTFLFAGIIASSYSTLAISQTERDLDSHEHGAAILTIVLEPSAIYLDFQSPWMNLVGFEHAAVSDADQQAVYEAIYTLADPQNLFTFAPGNCTGETIDMDVGLSGVSLTEAHDHGNENAHADKHADADEHAHDDEHGDKHADENEHAHGDEHADEHDDKHASAEKHEDEHAHHDDHADGDQDTHSELLASYRIECTEGVLPSIFTAELMQRFPGIETLQVEFVGPGGQSAASVTAGSAEVSLESVH